MEKTQPVTDVRSKHEHEVLFDVKKEICAMQTSEKCSDTEHGKVNDAPQEETEDADSGSNLDVDTPNSETLTKGVYCVKMCSTTQTEILKLGMCLKPHTCFTRGILVPKLS